MDWLVPRQPAVEVMLNVSPRNDPTDLAGAVGAPMTPQATPKAMPQAVPQASIARRSSRRGVALLKILASNSFPVARAVSL